LYELYELTDPRRGEESEKNKLRRAHVAIDLFWLVFGQLLLWAQSQIVGYEICKRHPDVADVLKRRRGKDLDSDSHELEILGMAVRNRPPSDEDEYEKFLDDIESECKYPLNDAALRSSIVHMLRSHDRNTSFWRNPLIDALSALNAGEVDPFLRPERTRRRGKAYQLDRWRRMAVSHVYFHVGRGETKHVALEFVAKKLNQSPDTIRSWEKALKNDDRCCARWRAAKIAGSHRKDNPKTFPRETLEEDFAFGLESDLDLARYFLVLMDSFYSLDNVRKELLELQRFENPNAASA
jgi:hypothetical protein